MADAIEIDASDFFRAAADLKAASRDMMSEVRPAVSNAALQVKEGMRADMAASRHFDQVADSITYDMRGNAVVSEAEVGPVTGGHGGGFIGPLPQGGKRGVVGDLAHFAYFGGANGGGGTVRDPKVHLEDEAPRFEKAIGDILDRLLG